MRDLAVEREAAEVRERSRTVGDLHAADGRGGEEAFADVDVVRIAENERKIVLDEADGVYRVRVRCGLRFRCVDVQQRFDVVRERVQRGRGRKIVRHGAPVVRVDERHARHDLPVGDESLDARGTVDDVRVRRDFGTGSRCGRDRDDALELLPGELFRDLSGSEQLGDVQPGLVGGPGGLRGVDHAAAADGDDFRAFALFQRLNDPCHVVQVGLGGDAFDETGLEFIVEHDVRHVGARAGLREGFASGHKRDDRLFFGEQELGGEVGEDAGAEVDADRLVMLEQFNVILIGGHGMFTLLRC